MSRSNPPTAGLFARLALASAVACAVLPAVVDWAQGVGGASSGRAPAPEAPTGIPAAATRVMGTLQTGEEPNESLVAPSRVPGPVDRLGFGAHAPFGPATEQGPRPSDSGDGAEPPVAAAGREAGDDGGREGGSAAPPPAASRVEPPVDGPLAPPSAIVPRAVPPAPPAAAATDARKDAAAPPATRPEAAGPPLARQQDPAGPAPERVQDQVKEQSKDQSPAKRSRSAATPPVRKPQRSAGADDAPAPTPPQWRPSNITNWPD